MELAEVFVLLTQLQAAVAGQDLSAADAEAAMLAILDNQASTALVAAFLVALKMKGETAAELTGFARAMRARVTRVDVPASAHPLLDTCGTGGDGASTFNISTVAALVAAGAGVSVAKHGNRSISSRCGSADLLEALGVRIEEDPARMARAIGEIGIAFLYAPALNPAMRHAQPARAELKMRTAFNLLGPLTNPAGAGRQLIGAPSLAAARLMADSLAALGTERSFVVHGAGGMDEVSTTGTTDVFEVSAEGVKAHVWSPADFGVKRANPADIAGGDIAANKEIAESVLGGGGGARRDIVLVNAAAALMAAGAAEAPRDAVQLAADSIASGRARAKLEQLAAFNRRR